MKLIRLLTRCLVLLYGRSPLTAAWAVPLRVIVHPENGHGPVIRPQEREQCSSLLAGRWRVIALLMTPRCSEGFAPTSANLDIFGQEDLSASWYSDDERLFGGGGDSKLIFSMRVGFSSSSKWKIKSCSDSAHQSCWPRHGDLLIMNVQVQDDSLHCADQVVMFCWIKQHAASCPLLMPGVVCCQRVRGFVPGLTEGGLWPCGVLLGALGGSFTMGTK